MVTDSHDNCDPPLIQMHYQVFMQHQVLLAAGGVHVFDNARLKLGIFTNCQSGEQKVEQEPSKWSLE